MMDEAETIEPLAIRSNDGPKSAARVRPDWGVEVRVRPVRRRIWPDEDKLRIVRAQDRRRTHAQPATLPLLQTPQSSPYFMTQ
jgi:hypothetical protein